MGSRILRSRVTWVLVACLAGAAAYYTFSSGKYEYEEELFLQLDGSGTMNVYASIASLVALHAAPLDPDPAAPPDPDAVRDVFEAPGVAVSDVSFYRRGRRRFVQVQLDVPDVRRLEESAPFSRSAVRFERAGEAVVYRQIVTAGRPGAAGSVVPAEEGWTGTELAAFKMHVPSKVLFENASSEVQRGNILVWEEPLAARLAGEPIDRHVQMETTSILASTLLLFVGAVAAVAVGFAIAIALLVRRGRAMQAELSA